MKKFIQRASRSFTLPPKPAGAPSTPTATNPTASHIPSLQPKYTVPPVPHPTAHDHIAVLVTEDALLLRPHFPSQSSKDLANYVRIPWGKGQEIGEIAATDDDNLDWNDGVIVYGVVGIVELFSCSYLLAISSRAEVGQHVEPSHTVYALKGITPIPLDLERARIVVNTLASRNAGLSRPSLIAKSTLDSLLSPLSPASTPFSAAETLETASSQTSPGPSSPRVQFSPVEQVKIMTPKTQQSFSLNPDEHTVQAPYNSPSASSSMSDLSSPSSDGEPMSPVTKTLANRLSFWSRLSKRTSLTPAQQESDGILDSSNHPQDVKRLEALIAEGKEEPATILSSILEATAPAPVSAEEKHSEMEDKIVREIIREFTKGGMYFAYNFDITRSLQHKRELLAKSERQNELLADLNALPSPESNDSFAPPSQSTDMALPEPYPTLPLWRRVDRQFWWNEWMAKPFVDNGLHSYVLPIMQGYYQSATITIPPDPVTSDRETPVDYIVVSRRSRDRAGLRYQRRGIDDEAHVANFVETETIVRVEREGVNNVFSYVQIRGSIPLFWTQAGYGLKPAPVLSADRTHAQSLDAMKRHFQRTQSRYGPHQCVNLAEQQGKEAAVTSAYGKCVRDLDMKDIRYYEYDFHVETRGMKYENISKLIDSMERTFENQGYLWIANNDVMVQQNGVYRTNCIDCLDRTNVVQSAFARYVLNKQLGAVALLNPSNTGNRAIIDVVFNDVWANNGDAISRAYAGTSALKGDFTRTGKRDLTGMLNDGVNSLARMYSSTFSDWFSQAVIDFMLGYRTLTVFSEFLLKLQSSDPRDLIRLSKIRAEAIATSVSRVLSEGERFLSGWTLFAPEELNIRLGDKFEEKVLLLTAKALYIIRYDYTLEKVKVYTRVPLGDIIGISKGAYILSPLEEASRDPKQNAGFIVSWSTANQVTRVSSYSVKNSVETPPPPPTAASAVDASVNPASPKPPLLGSPTAASITSMARTHLSTLSRKGNALSEVLNNTIVGSRNNQSYAAFKILPIDPARLRRGSSGGGGEYSEAADELSSAATCQEAAELVVDSIRKACEDIGNSRSDFVSELDVVSVTEAKRMTTVYAKMEYGVKRLLWLGAT